jgi:cysteine-rich repeat protein
MKTRVIVALSGVLVLFAACGRSSGGGDSETHWMKRCQTQSDCNAGTTCSCGMCSKECEASSDCSGLGATTLCVSPGEIPGCGMNPQPAGLCVASCSESPSCPLGFECSPNGCTPVATSDSGTGGMTSVDQAGNGGAACVEVPWGGGGAVHVAPLPPPTGTPCPLAAEGFELCTPPDSFLMVNQVLSRCSEGTWHTIENHSACEPINPACQAGTAMCDRMECNRPGATEMACCSVGRYCANLSGFCDGERWWISPLAPAGMCGDGIRQQGEQCDDGNQNSRDDCLADCVQPRCGDGVVHDQGTGGEACDDGNLAPGDGCDDACLIER